MTEALERLLDLYAERPRSRASRPPSFFMRVDVARVKGVLADLEQMTPDGTTADDFVDLAETHEFKPEIQEGECSA